MRSGQHNNKRSRGRSRSRHSGGSSGGGNPINRVYESNGPDVKVRGTAQTIADKYLQLGRDAQASGDNVMAENFYQHAEHYLRILAAAQAYNQQYQQQQQQYRRPQGDETFDEDEGDEAGEAEGGEAPPVERPQYVQEQARPASEVAESPSSGEARESEPQPPPQQRSRDYGRDRSRYRSPPDNRREAEDRTRQQQPRGEPPQTAPESQETPQPAAAGEAWDGPQPSFLKRPTNGSGNSRSRRAPRRETAEGSDAQESAVSEESPPVK
jgi:hypothetical protein